MLALLLMNALAAPPEFAPYDSDSLYAFVAVANDRIVDGSPYTNGDGIVSAGMLYANPVGFHASTELSAFRGSGTYLPDESVLTLESSAGWQAFLGDNNVSVALLDYRLNGSESHNHQGISLNYARDGLGIELAYERDKPYFNEPYGGFVTYDVRRAAVSWTQAVTREVSWHVGIGTQDFRSVTARHDYLAVGLLGRWREMEWQLSVATTLNDQGLVGQEDRDDTHLMLRVATPFRIK